MADDYPKWQPVAESTRQALELLGWGMPRCLPGEPEACGGNYAEHAAANLGVLKAVVEERITHLGPGSESLVDQVYADSVARLHAEPPCGRPGHGLGDSQ